MSLIRIQWIFSLIFQQNRCFCRNQRFWCTPKSLLRGIPLNKAEEVVWRSLDCVSRSRMTGAEMECLLFRRGVL